MHPQPGLAVQDVEEAVLARFGERLDPLPPMMLEAILPTGQKQVLSMVSDFNFTWMTTYVCADEAAPLLPKGTILKVTAWHDNATAKKEQSRSEPEGGLGRSHRRRNGARLVNIVYMKDDDFKIEQDKRRTTQTTAVPQQ
jgi:hypothetical protein